MAIQWGAWSTTGGNAVRLGAEWSYSGSTLNVTVYVNNQYNYSGDAWTLAWSGTFGSSSAGLTLTASSGAVSAVWSGSWAQTPNTTATLNFSGSAFYNGSTPSVTINPSLGPNPPAAPTGCASTYVSDTRIDTAWTDNPSSPAPYDNIAFYRMRAGDPDTIIAWLAGTATSYSDTTVGADQKVAYLATATNAAGATNSNLSTLIYTTPAAPSSAAAAKSGASDIAVTWTNNSSYKAEAPIEIWHAANGVWDGAALATLAANAASYVHTAPSTSVTHTYRVRAKTPSGTVRYSAYATSNVVTLATVPNPPVITGPPVTVGTETTPVTWSYSSNDTADQTQFQVQWRILGSGTWTTLSAVVSSAKTATLAANTFTNPNTYEVQVRVQGVPAMGWSAWSSTYTITTSARPTATITSTTPVKSSPISLTWTYFDPEGAAQSGWEAQITDAAGATVLASGSGFDQSLSWAPGLTIADGSTGKRRVRVRDGAGLWSVWSEQSYTTTFDPPAVPSGTVTWDAVNGRATITVLAGGGAGAPTSSLDVLRYDTQYGVGSVVVVASGLTTGQAVSDPDTPMTSTYVVRAVSAFPSYAYSSAYGLPTGTNTQYGYLSGGGRVARGLWNFQLGLDSTWDRAVFQADGRTYGIGVGTTGRTATQTVRTDLNSGDGTTSSADDFIAVANGSLVCLWRDPTGRTLRGVISNMTAGVDMAGQAALTFSVKRVDSV